MAGPIKDETQREHALKSNAELEALGKRGLVDAALSKLEPEKRGDKITDQENFLNSEDLVPEGGAINLLNRQETPEAESKLSVVHGQMEEPDSLVAKSKDMPLDSMDTIEKVPAPKFKVGELQQITPEAESKLSVVHGQMEEPDSLVAKSKDMPLDSMDTIEKVPAPKFKVGELQQITPEAESKLSVVHGQMEEPDSLVAKSKDMPLDSMDTIEKMPAPKFKVAELQQIQNEGEKEADPTTERLQKDSWKKLRENVIPKKNEIKTDDIAIDTETGIKTESEKEKYSPMKGQGQNEKSPIDDRSETWKGIDDNANEKRMTLAKEEYNKKKIEKIIEFLSELEGKNPKEIAGKMPLLQEKKKKLESMEEGNLTHFAQLTVKRIDDLIQKIIEDSKPKKSKLAKIQDASQNMAVSINEKIDKTGGFLSQKIKGKFGDKAFEKHALDTSKKIEERIRSAKGGILADGEYLFENREQLAQTLEEIISHDAFRNPSAKSKVEFTVMLLDIWINQNPLPPREAKKYSLEEEIGWYQDKIEPIRKMLVDKIDIDQKETVYDKDKIKEKESGKYYKLSGLVLERIEKVKAQKEKKKKIAEVVLDKLKAAEEELATKEIKAEIVKITEHEGNVAEELMIAVQKDFKYDTLTKAKVATSINKFFRERQHSAEKDPMKKVAEESIRGWDVAKKLIGPGVGDNFPLEKKKKFTHIALEHIDVHLKEADDYVKNEAKLSKKEPSEKWTPFKKDLEPLGSIRLDLEKGKYYTGIQKNSEDNTPIT